MRCSTTQLVLFVTGLTCRVAAALSGWDEVQLQLLESCSTPLRWYSTDTRHCWVRGDTVEGKLFECPRVVQLLPGQQIIVHVPATAWLRIVSSSDVLLPEDIQLSVSADGRVFADVVAIRSTDSRSLLIAMPQFGPSLVRIAHGARTDSVLAIELYFSQLWPLHTILPYSEQLQLSGEAIRMRASDEPIFERVWFVKPEEGAEFTVAGPAHLKLVARVPWECTEAAARRVLVLELRADELAPVPLLLIPEFEAGRNVKLHQAFGPISKRMTGYFSVPAGKHKLHIRPSVPVYLSIFRQSYRPFLLPKLNAPKAAEREVSWFDIPPALEDMWAVLVEPSAVPSAHDMCRVEQAAWRFAFDNSFRDAGAQAADLLCRVGNARHDYPVARQTAARMVRHRTLYREVLPVCKPRNVKLQHAFFVEPSLAPLHGPEQTVVIVNPTFDQVCETLAAGHFVSVPVGETNALLYVLPTRSFDSALRVAVLTDGGEQADFFVEFDSERRIRVVVDDKTSVAKPGLDVSRAVALLRVIEQEAGGSSEREVQLPFGEFDLPMPLATPGVIELPIAQTVRKVRVYQEPSSAPVKVSIAYRAARAFELCEADYLALLQQVGTNETFRLFANPLDARAGTTECGRLLASHFESLFRLLRSHCDDFGMGVDTTGVLKATHCELSELDVIELKSRASVLESKHQHIEAIERWNRIFWLGKPADRLEATLQIMRLLRLVGEAHLAMQYARVALCTAPLQQMPRAAIEYLAQEATQTGKTDQLEQVRAFVFMRCPCYQHLRELIEAFTLNCRYDAAMYAGLLLPTDQRPVEPMLTAAVNMNWWRTFDQLVQLLPTEHEKKFWLAQKDLAFLRFADAERNLEQAGILGAEMLGALRNGMRIRQRLGSERFTERLEGLCEWEQWQARHPGPRAWVEAGNLVSECAGGELVYNCELNIFLRCYRAEPEVPVKIGFFGPAKLRIEIRPIIESPLEGPLDDWVEISEYGITHRVPVTQCVPNPALELVSASNAFVGAKTTAALDFGPGLHEVEVRLVGGAGLVRVFREQPALPLRVLPTLNARHVGLVLDVDRQRAQLRMMGKAKRHNDVWIVPGEYARPAMFRSTVLPQDAYRLVTVPDRTLTPVQRVRLALRTWSSNDVKPSLDGDVLDALPVAEQWLAVRRWRRFDLFTRWDELADTERTAYMVASGQFRQLLDSNIPKGISERLNTLLQVCELFPAWRLEAHIKAELAVAGADLQPGCKELLDRMRRQTTWVPLQVTPTSAGLRPVRFRSDYAQYAASRVRQVLLPPADPDELTIGAQTVLSASITLKRKLDLAVQVGLVGAGFSPLAPTTVVLELDNAEVHRLELTAANPAIRTNLIVGEGRHLLRAWIEEPVVNQLVRIRLADCSNESADPHGQGALTLATTENRFFHVATTTDPVRFYLNGPALLRLDRWHDGALSQQLRHVPENEPLVEIHPPEGEPEALYRVFVLANQTNRLRTRTAFATTEPGRVPPPRLNLPSPASPAWVQLNDYYHLGGQEDGTWTVGLTYARRRPFELNERLDAVVNEFVELNAAHRKLSYCETLWYKTEALARAHQSGDITMGAEQRIERRAAGSGMNWLWVGEAYAGASGGRQQDLQAALHTSFEIGPRLDLTRKLEFYPSATFFGRYMTLDPGHAVRYDYVDQDLYTLYKHTHRWGIIAGGQFNYRPWLDTLIRCNLDLVSNENFTPDNCGLRFAWMQLMGCFRGELAWRLKQFFADTDRDSGSVAQSVSVGLYGEHWITGGHRFEFGLQYRHDWPGSASSYFVVVRCDFGRGRGYRDHGPRESPFGGLRSSRLPAAFNNKLEPGLSGSNMP